MPVPRLSARCETGRKRLLVRHPFEPIFGGAQHPHGRRERLGAGELCINSIDRDGTKAGYDLDVTRLISESVSIPMIASGGAGEPKHLYDAFTAGAADAAIVASIVHYGEHPIPDLKRYLRGRGVEVRDTAGMERSAK